MARYNAHGKGRTQRQNWPFGAENLMAKHLFSRFGAVALPLVLALVTSCVSRDDIESLQLAQKDIQARVEKLEKAKAQPAMPSAPRGPEAGKVYAVPVGQSASVGPVDAWVTIIEISDFQCPFCSRGANTMKEVVAKYKDDVRVVFKHNPLPFHPRAVPAAVAAECAGAQGKFWPMADAFFADQSKLSDEDIARLAKANKLDMAKFKTCTESSAVKQAVNDDAQLAGKFGARGTPAFFVNGRFISGAQPLDVFSTMIDEELKKAKASKISKADYYATAVVKQGAASL